MKSVIIYSLLLTVFFAVTGYLYVQEYFFQKSEIEKDIEGAFKESLDQDFETRLVESKLTYYSKFNPAPVSSSHQIIRQTSEGVTVTPYRKSLYNSTLEERSRSVFQDVLSRLVPIKAYQVDSLLQVNLQKRAIYGETNVGVFTEKDESYCRKKERINSSYYASKIVSLDPFDKLRVQAFVNYDSMTVLKRMYLVCAIGIVVCLATLVILFELIRRYRRGERLFFRTTNKLSVPPVASEVPQRVDSLRRLDDGHYRIGDALFIHEIGHVKNERTGKEIFIVPQLANTLALLLSMPYHYVKAAEIAEKLWPQKSMSVHDVGVQVGKVISKLRGELRKVVDIEIEKKNVTYLLKMGGNKNKKTASPHNGCYQVGKSRFDLVGLNLYTGGNRIPLTPEQASLLKFLLETPGKYASNADLIKILSLQAPATAANSEEAADNSFEALQTAMKALDHLFNGTDSIKLIADEGGYRLAGKEDLAETNDR